MALTKLSADVAIIQKLDDEPNDVGGLTAAQLKAKFDEGSILIKQWINETLLPEVERALSDTIVGQFDASMINPDSIGAWKLVDARSSAYDMDTVLQSGVHCAAYRVSDMTKGTPYNKGVSGFAYGVIISTAGSTTGGMQYAIIAGAPCTYSRRMVNGAIGEWEKEYSTGNKPTPAELGVPDLAGRGSLIPDGADLDSFITPGEYYVPESSNAQTLANTPAAVSGFRLTVKQGYASTYRTQIAEFTGPVVYTRFYVSTGFTPWRKIFDSTGGTMTGNMKIERASYPNLELKASETASDAIFQSGTQGCAEIINRAAGDSKNRSIFFVNRETAELAHALQLQRTINGENSAVYDILHTGNLGDFAMARVNYSSYIGTGAYGSSDPCSLTFEFEPKLVIIQLYKDDGAFLDDYLTVLVRGVTRYDGDSGKKITWDGKTVSWYATDASSQSNTAGYEYFVIAIG